MDSRGRRARAAVRSLGRRGLRQRIPDAVRAEVLGYVEEARRQGRPWTEIAEAVGLSKSALVRWRRTHRVTRPRLRPVKLAAPRVVGAPPVAVMTRTGHRIEGLSVADAVEVVRALG